MTMKLFRHLLVASVLAGASTLALADKVVTYTIDPNHSFVHFSWNHVGFSTPSADFTDVTGVITGNHDHPEKSSVEVLIPVKSLDTHVKLLNEHLIESGEYFKTKEFPNVAFKSTGIKNVDKKKDTFQLHGDLTVNGITKPVVLNAKLNKAGPHPFYHDAPAAGFNATTKIKRSSFGIDKFVPMVGDDLDVSITVEAIESEAWKKAQEGKK
jgi:polyisoprenoid-binding protein YceI